MAKSRQKKGTCAFCGRQLTKGGMTMRLRKCAELDEAPLLCAAHAASHPHDDYGDPMPLLNSPRVGLFGYGGPADPPVPSTVDHIRKSLG